MTMLEKALAKLHRNYGYIQTFPYGPDPHCRMTPAELMQRMTGVPTMEYDLCQLEKYQDFDKVLFDEWDRRKVLGTWRETEHKKDNKRYPMKCLHGEEGIAQLREKGIAEGYH